MRIKLWNNRDLEDSSSTRSSRQRPQAWVQCFSPLMAFAACILFAPSEILALTIDGPSGRIQAVTSNVPVFITLYNGSTDPYATADGDKSSNAGAFVNWANNDSDDNYQKVTFTYELDQFYNVSAFELWNDRGQKDTGIGEFQLDFFDGPILVDSFSSLAQIPNSTGPTVNGEEFVFPAAVNNVNKIDLVVLSSLGKVDNQFREVEFTGQVVPEPASFSLLSMGLLGLAAHVRRRGRVREITTRR